MAANESVITLRIGCSICGRSFCLRGPEEHGWVWPGDLWLASPNQQEVLKRQEVLKLVSSIVGKPLEGLSARDIHIPAWAALLVSTTRGRKRWTGRAKKALRRRLMRYAQNMEACTLLVAAETLKGEGPFLLECKAWLECVYGSKRESERAERASQEDLGGEQ